MAISAKLVKELRTRTGAGMMDCKKALVQTDGNIDDAIKYLREKGISKAAKKSDRVAAEGLVFEAVSEDKKTAVILEFNSETDFVAKNDQFNAYGNKLAKIIMENEVNNVEELLNFETDGKKISEQVAELIATIGENMNIRRFEKIQTEGFVTSYIHMGGKIGVILNMDGALSDDNELKAKDVAMHIAAMNPGYLKKEEVTQDDLDREREILRNQLLEEGKPEKIIDKILIGKINKFYEENCLLQQKFVKDDKSTVEKYLDDITVAKFIRFKLGEGIEKKEENFAEEVAAQIKQ